jgi:SulP family sulfate permease
MKSIGQKSEVLIIRMRHVPFIDSTGFHNLKEAIKNIQRVGTIVLLSGVQPKVRKDLIKGDIMDLIGDSYLPENFSDAINEGKRILNNSK